MQAFVAYRSQLWKTFPTTRQSRKYPCKAVGALSATQTIDAITNATNSAIPSAGSSPTSLHVVNDFAQATSEIPPEYLALGGVVLVALVGLAAFAAANKNSDAQSSTEVVRREPPPRKNAVLVVGAYGQSGQQVVKALISAGRNVVAAGRTGDVKKWKALGMNEGEQANGPGVLFLENGVDITKPATLKKALFKGVTQIVLACGAVSRPDGKGFVDGLSPEKVDGEGVANIVEAAKTHLPTPQKVTTPILQTSDFSAWAPKDDVIMGGSSSSSISVVDTEVAEWKGNLVVEGGGFCSISSGEQKMDLSPYDGLSLRVKGNGGQTFKFNVKTTDQVDKPVQAYQANFSVPGTDWVDVMIPWHEFIPTNQAKWNPEAGPLDPSKVNSIGLVYSRFDINNMPNPNYKAGSFSLSIQGGMSVYTAPRPSVVLISSASTERNAIIGDDAAKRAADIPIVQLNPAGTLNWKYKGETTLRGSGLAYSVLRPTGLIGETDPDEGKTLSIEFSQGDSIAGRVSRQELAAVVTSTLQEPKAVNTTFEIRRTERWAGGLIPFDSTAEKAEFLKLVPDTERRKVGLRPMPAWVPPPAPVSEERKKDILADPRVQAQQKRDQVESTDSSSETSAASSGAASVALRKAAAKQWIADYRARGTSASALAAAPDPDAEAKIAENKAAVQEWVAAWRAKVPEVQAASSSAADVQKQKEDAQKWIASWREATAKSGNGSGSNGNGAVTAQKAEVQKWIADWRGAQVAGKKELNKARR